MLKGSHKLGRIEHGPVGDQVGADVERVEQVMKVRREDSSCCIKVFLQSCYQFLSKLRFIRIHWLCKEIKLFAASLFHLIKQ